MRHRIHVFIVLTLAGLVGLSVAPRAADTLPELTERFSGRWVGTYTGDGAGKVTIVLSPASDDNHQGTLSAMSDSGEAYEAVFKVLTFEGTRMRAEYDVAEGEGALEGVFEGGSASGTWSYHDSSGNSSGGTWKMTREESSKQDK
jgi:hypothetical protein